MHFQTRIQDWPRAVLSLPDQAIVKSVSDASLLREVVQVWTKAGRERSQITTCYRHYDVSTPPATASWAEARDWWRAMFFRFVDRTYLEQCAEFIDLVQGANEHTASSTWTDKADKARALMSERAAADVWNSEFRGQLVHSNDGGEGLIPASCRLTLLSGPVSNDIPREILELSILEDAPIDYHAYSRWTRGVRYVNDWQDDSGRWAITEETYGLKPDWVFGECGPYGGVTEGWRHPTVLGGDLALLRQAMRAWYTDVIATPAFKDGRICGQGAWFTSGIDPTWSYYQLFTPDLIAVSDAIRDLWKMEKTMRVLTWEEINAGDKVKAAIDSGCLVYLDDKVTLWNYTDGHPRVSTWIMDVFEITADGWLRVSDGATRLWVRGLDVKKAS